MSELPPETTFNAIWQRLLLMLLFFVLFYLAEFLVFCIAALQFIWVLFTDDKNPNLLQLGLGLSLWTGQVFKFLTFNSEQLPYPFSPWPTEQE